MICDNLVFGWLIERVELFGCARVGSVDCHWGEPVHDMATAYSAAIG